MTPRKLDLLHDCNDQRIPVKDFTATFCVRCRNNECVNSGWSSSNWEARMGTQVDRLLINPLQARQDDTRFDSVRAMHFVEIAAAIVLARRADPWSGPGVHLAEPDPLTTTSSVVEDAVSKLAAARGKPPPVERPVLDLPVAPAEVVAKSVPAPPVAARLPVNTEFPDEGVMLGGNGPAMKPEGQEDLWAPKKKHNLVQPGAKIRMDG